MIDVTAGIIGNGYTIIKIDTTVYEVLKEKGINETGLHYKNRSIYMNQSKLSQAWYKHIELSRDYTSFSDTKNIYIYHNHNPSKTTYYRILEHLNDYAYIKQDITEIFKDSWNIQRFDILGKPNNNIVNGLLVFKYGTDPIAMICTEKTDYPRYRPTETPRLD